MDPLETPKHLIQNGETKRACIELGKILRSDPNNLEAWELLSTMLTDPKQKEDCYHQIIRIDPKNRQAAQHLQAMSIENDHPSKSGKSTTPKIPLSAQEIDSSIDDLRKLVQDDVLEDSTDDQTDEERIEFATASQTDSQPSPISFDESPMLGAEVDEDPPAALPHLGSADIINLAGHPLPQDERLKCPNCDATISRFETKCPWCSKVFTS